MMSKAPKKKPAKKKAPKKRAAKYEKKLIINGTLEDVLKASLKGLD